jgi:hypothetical protein
MPDGKLWNSAACVASLFLDIDNEQGRLLFQESQKLGERALSAQTLFMRNIRSSAVSPPWA